MWKLLWNETKHERLRELAKKVDFGFVDKWPILPQKRT